jgi:hypothetical protein
MGFRDMQRHQRPGMAAERTIAWLVVCLIATCPCSPLWAAPQQLEPTPPSRFTASPAELESLEQMLQSVAEENTRLSKEVEQLKEQSLPILNAIETENTWNPPTHEMQSQLANGETTTTPSSRYYVDYENGILIRPKSYKDSPFSLKFNHQDTFRYTGFAREEATWVDSSGKVLPIFDSSDFAIPRGRLLLSGTALMPDLSYLLNIDYNTVNNNPIGFRAYVLSYRFSKGFQASVGQNKVPGTREWLHSSFDAQAGPDRSMATTFFRPSLSQGIWFTGEPKDGLHYHAMLSNGFNTLNLNRGELNSRYCGSESIWWEPWGDFGRGYSDIEYHHSPALRLGNSITYSIEEGSQASDYPENTLVRLSDGTLITQVGAFAPNVTLQSFHLSLIAIDVALKYRGLSLSTEIYRQGLQSLRANGPLPVSSLQTYGGVAQLGYFIVPGSVEVYSRNSFVTGAYGSGTEIGTGFNWFVLKGKSNLRFTFDTAHLDSSPADQNRTGFIAGQSGFLIRTQITTSF